MSARRPLPVRGAHPCGLAGGSMLVGMRPLLLVAAQMPRHEWAQRLPLPAAGSTHEDLRGRRVVQVGVDQGAARGKDGVAQDHQHDANLEEDRDAEGQFLPPAALRREGSKEDHGDGRQDEGGALDPQGDDEVPEARLGQHGTSEAPVVAVGARTSRGGDARADDVGPHATHQAAPSLPLVGRRKLQEVPAAGSADEQRALDAPDLVHGADGGCGLAKRCVQHQA
mmetsp:Transcript_76584/g.234492  ORF Transcript_76584/g.234492 Transcript_76584/m.234492 type:complete len:225 (+) Transcript_76584:314-988(+)